MVKYLIGLIFFVIISSCKTATRMPFRMDFSLKNDSIRVNSKLNVLLDFINIDSQIVMFYPYSKINFFYMDIERHYNIGQIKDSNISKTTNFKDSIIKLLPNQNIQIKYEIFIDSNTFQTGNYVIKADYNTKYSKKRTYSKTNKQKVNYLSRSNIVCFHVFN